MTCEFFYSTLLSIPLQYNTLGWYSKFKEGNNSLVDKYILVENELQQGRWYKLIRMDRNFKNNNSAFSKCLLHINIKQLPLIFTSRTFHNVPLPASCYLFFWKSATRKKVIILSMNSLDFPSGRLCHEN